MEFEEIAKKYKNFYAPSYQILVDGKDIFKEDLVEIVSVTFDDTLDGADRFAITINDPDAGWLDDELFEPGKEVEIKMGYVDTLATMVVGEIVSLKPSFPTDGNPQLEVSGYDLSHQFTRVRKHRSFEDMKDSEMVAGIASEAKHKLKTQIETTETVHPHVVQDRQTNYEFIKELADRNFFEFFVKERTLYFQKPKKDESEIATLKYGTSLLSFNPELNTANQVSQVTVMGWNPKTREEIVGSASSGEGSGGSMVEDQYGAVEERILDRPVFTQQEADVLASSILNRLSEGLIKGSADCIGIPDIRAGESIKLEGLGNKFSRKYYIERTTHTISNSGYSTTFNIKENTI
ncbi:MAG: phage late control D family protein [Candidatus Methanospirareceae archaeon]